MEQVKNPTGMERIALLQYKEQTDFFCKQDILVVRELAKYGQC